jgi:hypothetical protein
MVSAISRQLGPDIIFVYVWGAAPYIRRALLTDGEVVVSNTVDDGDTRMLAHGVANRARVRLPWPLSAAQPHDIDYTVTNSTGTIVRSKTYKRAQVDAAIAEMLAGLGRSDEIMINVS